MKDNRLEIARLLGEIQTLSFMVNTFTDYCVFAEYSGHVDKFEISIRESKEDYKSRISSDEMYELINRGERSIHFLKKIKNNLRKILRERKIDYSRLNYEIEEVRHYKLS